MNDRRGGERLMVSFPIRIRWKDESGKEIVQEGLTENVGPNGTLIYLPRNLPLVGGKVNLTVTENPDDEVTVVASVIRLERNASHPQVALQLVASSLPKISSISSGVQTKNFPSSPSLSASCVE